MEIPYNKRYWVYKNVSYLIQFTGTNLIFAKLYVIIEHPDIYWVPQ